jgi:hypothetical protein
MKRRLLTIVAGLACVLLAGRLAVELAEDLSRIQAPAATPPPAAAAGRSRDTAPCAEGPANALSSATDDLDHAAADWGVYCEGAPAWRKQNAATPSLDGTALECSITGGAPYSNVHCYRNLRSEPASAVFTLNLAFWFSPTAACPGDSCPVQALEFTMNKWYQQTRWEFALQWQNVGPGAPQWRYWDPRQQWVAFSPPIIPNPAAGQWHTFRLDGEILDGQAHYTRFALDQETYPLDLTVPPAAAPGEADRLAAAVQLDGNYAATPYSLYIDRVSFIRRSRPPPTRAAPGPHRAPH